MAVFVFGACSRKLALSTCKATVIFTLPSVLSPEHVASLRARLAATPYENGTATASGVAATVKNNLQLNLHQPHAMEMSQEVAQQLLAHEQFQQT
ncbi:MAG: hypothetical protein RLZZ271_1417, partial [Pseudomonadota bacterium]